MCCRLLVSRLLVLVLLLTFTLPVAARGTINGSVVDRDGNPLVKIGILVSPYDDPKLLNYDLATNKKGAYFVYVKNGQYKVALVDDEMALDRMSIHIEDDGREAIYDWDEKVLPGTDIPPITVESNYRITVNLVAASKATLRAEQSDILKGHIAAALTRGDRTGAMKAVSALLDNSPDDPMGLTLRAYIAAEEGRNDEAEPDLRRALEQDPDLFDARYQLATLYRQTDRTDEALELFRAIVESEQGRRKAQALLNVGEMERAEENLPAAIEAFEAAVEAHPEFRNMVAPELADLHTKSGNIERAEEWLGTTGATDGVDPALQYNLGIEHLKKDEWAEAAEFFRKAIEADPELAEAHRELGTALLNQGMREEAAEQFAAYVSLRPDADDAPQFQALVDALSK